MKKLPIRSSRGASRWARGSVVALLLTMTLQASPSRDGPVISGPEGKSFAATLAPREVRRYVYLRTGELLPILSAVPRDRDSIIFQVDHALDSEEYRLKTEKEGPCRVLRISGGSEVAALYGAYRFAELLGVRFYLHGDVIPDDRMRFTLPVVDEVHKPLFDTRGIQPFHDFPEGPDWWEQDDYLAYMGQLAKLRMNFFGLHCYPEGGVGPEPAVWIGLPQDLAENGQVKFSYPSQWANTARDGMWGYAAMKTSEFSSGASLPFEADAFGPAVMAGMMPRPDTAEECDTLFERSAALLGCVVAGARQLGIKTCIGTETPLTVPKILRQRIEASGREADDPQVVREIYEAMFRRIARLYPVDYYWLWTPEHWTWGGEKTGQYDATVRDIRSALEALESLGRPFSLATSGWVLGPKHDRAALDMVLPKTVPMSCINREVGHAAVEPGFKNVSGRPKWAIPWMENDPNMIGPQPWVGRMRYDAADARRLGCSGLLGIHWRTKVLAQNVAALAAAAWDQSWVPPEFHEEAARKKPEQFGAIGGSIARFTAPVADTDEDPLYQVVRYDVDGYRLEVPDGLYNITLKFNEPHYSEAGKRLFGAKLQGKPVIETLDIFARVGKNKALDFTFKNVDVTEGPLRIDFVRQTELPCIAGIVIEGCGDRSDPSAPAPFQRKINCGGGLYEDYEADDAEGEKENALRSRGMPVEAFYVDFARAHFGDSVGDQAGSILASIDGTVLPETSTWIKGPGGILVNTSPWQKEKGHYEFLGKLAKLRQRVTGAGNLERFDYWLNTFRFMASTTQAGCLRGRLDTLVKQINSEQDPAAKQKLAEEGLSVRLQLARVWERLVTQQLAATDTPGELGTLANLEQHNRRFLRFLDLHDVALEEALGKALPPEIQPTTEYLGTPRLAVPTIRTQMASGESLKLKVLFFDTEPARAASLEWRSLGEGDYRTIELEHLARGVYGVRLPAPINNSFEYFIQARTAGGKTLRWPATAPRVNQTVVVTPAPARRL